jgi:hypothetical protein
LTLRNTEHCQIYVSNEAEIRGRGEPLLEQSRCNGGVALDSAHLGGTCIDPDYADAQTGELKSQLYSIFMEPHNCDALQMACFVRPLAMSTRCRGPVI